MPIRLWLFLVPLHLSLAVQSARVQPPVLRVWLLPAERGVNTDVTDVRKLESLMDEFRDSVVPPGVLVENVSDPVLRAQLLAWNSEFAMPNFGWLRGQTATLQALGRFAKENGVQVKVRFNTWTNAFTELTDAVRIDQLPDVAQVGSTWVARLGDEKLLRPCLLRGTGEIWRALPGSPCASLRYLVDVRLLYYWRQPPVAPMLDRPFIIDSSSWTSLIESLRSSAVPPMVLPIGLTYNVMHDLFPLFGPDPQKGIFEVGRWANRAHLAAPAQLAVPKFIAANAVVRDGRGFPRRIIAFPEVTHEEALRSFQVGGYVAIMEPAGYLTRWRENYRLQGAKGDFWRYAGIVAPPSGILGGSDLVVLKTGTDHALALALARFLATDIEYSGTLAQLGNLPAHNIDSAIDILVRSAAGADRVDIIRQVGQEIRLSLRRGREYPSLGEWATEVESRPVLESVQRVWRRMAEGDPSKVEESVRELEHLVNSRVDPSTIAFERVISVWREVSVGLTLIMLALWWSSRRRATLLDHVRKVRGFSSAALATLDCAHYRRNPFPGDLQERDKAALIATGLVGLRRGLDPSNWEPERLSSVVWRSIVMALDSVHDAALAQRWQDQSLPAEAFLWRELLLRPSAAFVSGDPPFHFALTSTKDPKVALPFMIEQALTCIIQNSLKACKTKHPLGEAYFPTVKVEITNTAITVANEDNSKKAFSPELYQLINSNPSIETFDVGVRRLLEGPAEHRPGVGLVEAYCIASLCYDGLELTVRDNLVLVTVTLAPSVAVRIARKTRAGVAWVREQLGFGPA